MSHFPNKFGPTWLLLLPLVAHADYQDGLDAFTFGDYATAMKEWRAVTDGPATAVSPAIYIEAHYAVAMLYWQGQGVAVDFRQAYDWLLKAAEMGHAGAQAKLGFLYTDGKAVARDHGQAFEWFSQAAKGGNVDGLYNLGIFYLYGWGVEQDTTMAAQYLAAAAALGDEAAEQALPQVLKQIEEEQSRAAPAPTVSMDEDVGGRSAADSRELGSPLQEDWIRAQNPQHYTIQVMALRSRDSVEELTRKYAELAPFAVFTVQKGTKPLHVLLQGDYPDVESARAAKARFPREIQQQDALWIRRFDMVQRLLEQ